MERWISESQAGPFGGGAGYRAAKVQGSGSRGGRLLLRTRSILGADKPDSGRAEREE
jgi:hypothetical protein